MSELSAITLVTDDMAASLDFWLVPGIEVVFGGPDAAFTTVRLGVDHVNLIAGEPSPGFWGRVVIHVPSPDQLHRAMAEAGYPSETMPADAPWGERYFHILDPAGHEISFARPLNPVDHDGSELARTVTESGIEDGVDGPKEEQG